MRILVPLLRLLGRQNVIQWGKLRLLHALIPPESFDSQRFTIDFYGLQYSGDLSNYIDWRVYMTGAYEPEALQLLSDMADLLRRLGRQVHYVDIGANVGHHALFMSQRVKQVTAFEPFPRCVDEIRLKVAQNGLSNVEVLPFALGAEEAALPLQTDGDNNLGTASLVATRAAPENQRPVAVVPVYVGDQVFEAQQLPPIDLLKIDVEGFEANVLRGLRSRLLQDRPIILSEVSGEDLSGFLTADAFRAALYPDHALFSVVVRGGRYALEPFSFASGDVLCVPAELLPLMDARQKSYQRSAA